VTQIYLYLPLFFPFNISLGFVCLFLYASCSLTGLYFDGDNRPLIRRAADGRERKDIHEMRVVGVEERLGCGGLGDIITPSSLNKGMANESRELTRSSTW
jgi:hypothetical protein